jgi:hypothetical protein
MQYGASEEAKLWRGAISPSSRSRWGVLKRNLSWLLFGWVVSISRWEAAAAAGRTKVLMSDFMVVPPLGGLDNRLHWRKRFGAGKGANELKVILEARGQESKFASTAIDKRPSSAGNSDLIVVGCGWPFLLGGCALVSEGGW